MRCDVHSNFSPLALSRKMRKHAHRTWEAHWREKRERIFERVCSFYRKCFIANQVRVHVERYFPREGIFLEMGAGTCESSVKITRGKRILGAVDFSASALAIAKENAFMHFYIQADIFSLPFRDSSVNGIWNVGVMEHFTREELLKILKEFNRVLRKGGYCILLWPWIIAPSHLIFNTYEWIIRKLGTNIQVFPASPSMFKHRKPVESILKEAGFGDIRFHHPLLDLTHWVVVGRKK